MRDAFLLLSFGGPEGPDDVLPFLRNVTHGRNVPEARLAEVAQHYYQFGGVSPINAHNRALLAAIERELQRQGVHAQESLPLYWGNRNWHPYLANTLTTMRDDGIRRAFAFITSAYSSYSARDQYLEDITHAREAVSDAPEVICSPAYFDNPGFLEAHADALREALSPVSSLARVGFLWGLRGSNPTKIRHSRILFVAHSIPVTMHQECDGAYEAQLRFVAEHVAMAVMPDMQWELVWQSRSGPPEVPWLEPDINDRIRTLADEGVHNVVVCPIGFISDHMEVIWDLDVEAAHTARESGLNFVRAATPGTHPAFVAMIRELTAEALTR